MKSNPITHLATLYQKLRLSLGYPFVDTLSLHIKLEDFYTKRGLLVEDLLTYATDDVVLREISEIFWNYDNYQDIFYSDYEMKFMRGATH